MNEAMNAEQYECNKDFSETVHFASLVKKVNYCSKVWGERFFFKEIYIFILQGCKDSFYFKNVGPANVHVHRKTIRLYSAFTNKSYLKCRTSFVTDAILSFAISSFYLFINNWSIPFPSSSYSPCLNQKTYLII